MGLLTSLWDDEILERGETRRDRICTVSGKGRRFNSGRPHHSFICSRLMNLFYNLCRISEYSLYLFSTSLMLWMRAFYSPLCVRAIFFSASTTTVTIIVFTFSLQLPSFLFLGLSQFQVMLDCFSRVLSSKCL